MTKLTEPMNKANRILLMIALVLLTIMIAVGCTVDNRKPITVIAVDKLRHSGACFYTLRTNCDPDESNFIDDCNKFQIGDTVRFEKVQP